MSLCRHGFHTICNEQTYSEYKINKSLSLIIHALSSAEILHCFCLMHHQSNLLGISCVRKFARLHVKQHFNDTKPMLKQSSIMKLEEAALNENTCMYLDVCMATC